MPSRDKSNALFSIINKLYKEIFNNLSKENLWTRIVSVLDSFQLVGFRLCIINHLTRIIH